MEDFQERYKYMNQIIDKGNKLNFICSSIKMERKVHPFCEKKVSEMTELLKYDTVESYLKIIKIYDELIDYLQKEDAYAKYCLLKELRLIDDINACIMNNYYYEVLQFEI